jgi:predicted metal-dependent hydrolase
MQGLFEKGVVAFNARDFFEAHDLWEELWRETRGNHRLFYQGLIQTAVGFYHLRNKNYRGACSQLGKALLKLEHYLPSFECIETGDLVTSTRRCLRDAEHLRDGVTERFDESTIPLIQWSTIE